MSKRKSRLISTTMLATRLGFTPQYIRKLIGEGKLKATKLAHDWIIEEKDIQKLTRRRPIKVKENTDGAINSALE